MITAMPRIAIAVEDFPAVIARFRDTLNMPVIDWSETSVDSLGAQLGFCVPQSGSNIEIMAPGDPQTPLSQSVERFIERRGQGPFAMMLEAADPDAEAEGLVQRGLKVLPRMEGAGGRDVHPASTHGVLIRVYPIDSFVEKASDYVAAPDGPGLTGITRVLIAVRDLDAAIATYGEKFAMEVSPPSDAPERGTRSAICRPPAGGIIELITPVAQTVFADALDAFLGSRGEGLYALVLGTDNVQHAGKALEANGLDISPVPGLPETLEIDPDAMFGNRFWIEQNT